MTSEERAEREGLVRSTMTHYRTRFTADGVATRAIAGEVNCAIGAAAKWRVRYAKGPHTRIRIEFSEGTGQAAGKETR